LEVSTIAIYTVLCLGFAQAKTSHRQADKKRTVAPHVGHLFREDAWVGP